jgi:integral membrane protein (TIGR01906 family)
LIKWISGYAGALCLLVIIVSQSVIIPTFFLPFFDWHYNRENISESIQITHDDLMHVTTELLDYMRGRRDSLEGITALVGEIRSYGENFFSEREILHMQDVKTLYDLLFAARNVAFFLLVAIVLFMILVKENPLFLLARCSREVLAGFLGVAAILAVIISFDFKRSWEIFHYIFFHNDTFKFWVLTPYADLMINLFPLHFFAYISVFAAVIVTLFSAAVIAGGSVYLHLNRDRFSR